MNSADLVPISNIHICFCFGIEFINNCIPKIKNKIEKIVIYKAPVTSHFWETWNSFLPFILSSIYRINTSTIPTNFNLYTTSNIYYSFEMPEQVNCQYDCHCSNCACENTCNCCAKPACACTNSASNECSCQTCKCQTCKC
ncbi:Hypothetical protein J6890_02243 [Nakaseomyces glabratus]